jgi:hypothetical protein
MAKILSVLTVPVSFPLRTEKNADGKVHESDYFIVDGRHGLVDKEGNLLQGITTNVSNEQLEILNKDNTFQRMIKRGHYKVIDDNRDPISHISDMKQDVNSSPVSEGDINDELEQQGLGDIAVSEQSEALEKAGKIRKTK